MAAPQAHMSRGGIRGYLEMDELSMTEDIYRARSRDDPTVAGAPRNLQELKEKHQRLHLMTKFESHNYDPADSVLERAVLQQRSKAQVDTAERIKWLMAGMIGLAVGVAASIVDWFINSLHEFKFSGVASMLHEDSRESLFPYTVYASIVLILAALAGGVVSYLEPLAAGSGIPEIKIWLNGVHMPGLLRIRTLAVKLFGVCFTIGSGIVAGKEGPFVHAGGLIAHGLSQMASPSLNIDLKYPNQFRNDADQRDFVTIGTATGVACAFGAPIGGILFATEEGASFHSTGNIWRGFLATSIGVLTVQTLFQLRSDGYKTFEAHFGIHREFGLYNDDQAQYSRNYWWYLWEVPIFIMMGAFQGLMGALFVRANLLVVALRDRHIPATRPGRRMMEVLMIAFVTCTFAFLATYYSDCKPLPEALRNARQKALNIGALGNEEEYGEIHSLAQIGDLYFKRWTCQKGEYNTMGQLFFTPLANTLKLLCHLGEMQEDADEAHIFGTDALFTFYILTFLLMTWTYGSGCAMGLFVPSLVVGATFGQLCGHVVHAMVDAVDGAEVITPNMHTYAVIGAAGMLGGCTRMTISITVLVMETTGAMQLVLPLMFTIFSAKWVGDFFSHGVYDQCIETRGAPFLEEYKYSSKYSSLVGESCMASEKLDVYEVMPHGQAMVTLHPVVKVKDLIDTLESCEHGAFPVSPETPTNERPEFALHGVITRTKVSKILQHRIGFLENGEDAFKLPEHPGVREAVLQLLADSPYKALPIDKLKIPVEMYETRVDLRPFMHRNPYVVSKGASLSRAYRLFRTMGLRHLFVTTDVPPRVIGVVTRKDLHEDHAGLVIGHKAAVLSAHNPVFGGQSSSVQNPMAGAENSAQDAEPSQPPHVMESTPQSDQL